MQTPASTIPFWPRSMRVLPSKNTTPLRLNPDIASNMSSMHNEILDAHDRITKQFLELEGEWGKLLKHATNLAGKISPVASKVTTLGGEIDGLKNLSKSLTSAESALELSVAGGSESSEEE